MADGLEIILFMVLCVFGLVNLVTTAIALIKLCKGGYREMRTHNMPLWSLLVGNSLLMCVGVAEMCVIVFWKSETDVRLTVCKAILYAKNATMFTIAYTICLMSVIQYKNMKSHFYVSKCVTRMAIVTAWAIGFIFNAGFLLGSLPGIPAYTHYCVINYNFPEVIGAVLLFHLGYALPLVGVAASATASLCLFSRQQDIQKKKEIMPYSILTVSLAVMYVLWWCPYHLHYYMFFTRDPSMVHFFDSFLITMLMVYANSAISPILIAITASKVMRYRDTDRVFYVHRDRSDLEALLPTPSESNYSMKQSQSRDSLETTFSYRSNGGEAVEYWGCTNGLAKQLKKPLAHRRVPNSDSSQLLLAEGQCPPILEES